MRLLVITALVAAASPLGAQRVVVSLDGEWQIEESVDAGAIPASFTHRGRVPGLTNQASPAFPGVDLFDSVENIDKKIRLKALPPSAMINNAGIPRQKRNYFWYRTTFRPPAKKAVALLKVNKAQFGTAVWLNGKPLGDHLGCFTAGYFDLTAAMRWTGENELVVRIGAHPGVLPESVPCGTDNEKLRWTPGIYDSVAVLLSDNPVIETVQVAPRIRSSEILVETVVHNFGGARSVTLVQRVAGQAATRKFQLGQGARKTVRQTIRIPGVRLWTPETPHLYTLESSTGGDTLATRFGMREFRFDTTTKRAYLNGKPYFLRGSNITLHRFFEDPECKGLPWDGKWVRKLLVDIPKRMHWNAFRFCIGPVPDQWLDIADEAGLLIQNEYFVWGWRKQWNIDTAISQYKEWMRDNWNHPSVAIWDAQNETRADELSRIISAVRGLDLSNRPWENGYNLPVGPDDPVEDHPYHFSGLGRSFEVPDLEKLTGAKSTNAAHPTAHPVIINEYAWLWLNRDGSPTELTRDVYARLVGANASPEERFEAYGYYLGGETEFWRAHRNAAGVLHFVYLTCSFPGAYTADHWLDLANLKLEPHFEDYLGEAFKPLGVYLNFWQPRLKAGSERRFAVMVINDEPATVRGTLELSIGGARVETPFEVPGLGQQTYNLDLRVPSAAGAALVKATAIPEKGTPTVSRRKVTIE
jgi:hypothetical protein